MKNTLPAFSVVIEWENARLSELSRAEAMLSTLAQQIASLGDQLEAPPELIVLYSPEAIKPSLVQGLLDCAFEGQDNIDRRLLPTEKGTYYKQKNYGANIARHDLVMFLDSDVVPEPDWLRTLLSSFHDPNVAIACGNTYIDTKNIYSKAFALFWFFPLRSKQAELLPSPYFFANNVVFRRDLFLRYKFPDLPYLRGQCTALARALTDDGHKIYIQNGARVSHPPPNGLAHFVKRALCEGHDLAHRTKKNAGFDFPRGALGRYRTFLRDSSRRVWRDRKEVGLGVTGAIAASGIAFSYYSLCLIGETITQVKPDYVREKLAV